jgi:hypothetical protein
MSIDGQNAFLRRKDRFFNVENEGKERKMAFPDFRDVGRRHILRGPKSLFLNKKNKKSVLKPKF